MFGGIEAGGTKFVCGIGTSPEDLQFSQFSTTVPEETIPQVVEFFRKHAGSGLQAVGIGSFGPVDIHPHSRTFGHITSTPKVGWKNFDLRGAIESALQVPVGFETDVNVAALAEARWGGAVGLADFVYMTIGTGVGGGAMVNNQLLHGLVHAEMGHLRLPHDSNEDPFEGLCPFHGDCLEGMASGPAMKARWGKPASELPPEHPAWTIEANYLALGIANLTFALSPRRFLMGGGVMQQQHLFGLIREKFARLLNGYLRHPDLLERLDEYIVPPQLGGRAGVLGAIAFAEQVHAAAPSSLRNPVEFTEEGKNA
jgi:fructokinase